MSANLILRKAHPVSIWTFEIHPGSEMAADLLENRKKNIELVAVRQESETANMVATVFVPDAAADHFLKKVEAYRAENTKSGKPKNEALISRIQTIALAAVRSVYTDDQTTVSSARRAHLVGNLDSAGTRRGIRCRCPSPRNSGFTASGLCSRTGSAAGAWG